ncbi:hypothetical protein [Salinarimonas rosea]|uniref:hypothetical protein n=1 Tax=Salinarimonas rosea TaxID=552063 RepID=UPI0004174D9F|nr:hypothetical protein [Salinarimonas rosea]
MAGTAEQEASGGLATLRRTLARHHVDEARLARSVEAYLDAHARHLLPPSRPEPLTRGERAALEAVGISTADHAPDPQPFLDGVARHAVIVATALPLAEAARRFGVAPSRLRQRLQERTLLGVRSEDGRAWRIPLFQITEAGELPGLRLVLKAIRSDLRPVTIVGFFTTPQPDLEDETGAAMTPIAWLSSGRDPDAVRRLAAEL